MAVPSPGYSITLRVATAVGQSSTSDLVAAAAATGAGITALDVVESTPDTVVIDVSADTRDVAHAEEVSTELSALPGVDVREGLRSDLPPPPRREARIDAEGAAAQPRRPLPCLHPRRGSGVQGDRREQGRREAPDDQTQHRRRRHGRDRGPRPRRHRARSGDAGDGGQGRPLQAVRGGRCVAGGPRHEGHRGDHRDLQGHRPGLRGINLEDISAPRRFEIERRLRAELDIPVFHDDQHGTGIVTLAALKNALKVVGKDIAEVRIVVSGVGAGHAIIRLLQVAGAQTIIACGRDGAIGPNSTVDTEHKVWLKENTNPEGFEGASRRRSAVPTSSSASRLRTC